MYNGYSNYETWAFMLYFQEYLYEILREKQEYEKEEINFATVYETVENIIDELSESVDRVEFGYSFIKDIVDASLNSIDIHEVTETLMKDLKDD